MNPFSWLWEQFNDLLHMADDPDRLRTFVDLGGNPWAKYAILSGVIFSETGLLVGFFLPGDSLLFAAGLLAGQGLFDIVLLNLCLISAAISGDAVNYWLGAKMGEKVFERGKLRFVKHEHLIAAKDFYERHGGIAIVLARFMPLVRTFTPFVAGIARMSYRQFLFYNVIGGVSWVVLFSMAGYLLGSIPIVKNNFKMVSLIIVGISLLPLVVAVVKHRFGRKATPSEVASNRDAA